MRTFVHEPLKELHGLNIPGHTLGVTDIPFPKDGLLKDYDVVEVLEHHWIGDAEIKTKVEFAVFYKKVFYDDLYVKLEPKSITSEPVQKFMNPEDDSET